MSVAWLFPGQGSQSVGMGKELAAGSVAARNVFERLDAALGEPLSNVIFEGPEDFLTLTANAQPAILATSHAVLAAIREQNGELPWPAFAAGHSLGEYSALVATGAFSLEDALRLVRTRGKAMQDAVPPGTGAMSAIIGVDPALLAKICADAAQGEVVAPANFNAPGQVVIAGHAAAVARANDLVALQNGRAKALKVSAPFHCKLMEMAARVLEAELERIPVLCPSFPVVANVDAQPNADPARIKGLLVRQVDGAVRWEESIRFMADRGVTHALEIGPGKVLAGLVKRIAKTIKVLSVGDSESVRQVPAFLAEAKSHASCDMP